ncbi:monovalent cation/H+ antiporter complex subunit F [Rubrobacter indicoceani]|uniref:monovalent cation/H+ antiporter complex subunit F n=1 Tax=Rubrobacter indicoceani TaxID=2051957 RepID=UPI000E5A4CF4|nr:monovalent cation/H+ antiporter complex subunit F [Rubrobacter indicoceani]
MGDFIFYIAAAWMTVLFGVSVVLVIKRRSPADRIQALDVLTLILIALLVLFTDSQGVPYYLDAALVLALLSFIATVAAARYYIKGRIF